MKLSVCMIVKNEERFIKDCLESVKYLADEIIVVDTGSTDKTIDIAKAYGAKIFKFEWADNFSKARNFSISKATGDWIFVIDADETISRQDHDKIRQLMKEKDDGFSLIQRTYYDDSTKAKWISAKGDKYEESKPYSGWIYSNLVRLFRRKKEIFYQNAVHESVVDSIRSFDGSIVKTDIPIHHYGKALSDKLDEKNKLYEKLGEKKLEEKESARGHYELGVQQHVLGKLKDAEINLLKAIELGEKDYHHVNLGAIYLKQKRYDDAQNCFKKAIELNPDNSDAYFNQGVIYELKKKNKEAVEHYQESIRKNPKNSEAYSNIARIFMMHNLHDRAMELLERAVQINPKNFHALQNLGVLYAMKQKFDPAIEVMEKALKIEDNADIMLNLGNAYGEKGSHDKALYWFKRFNEKKPDNKYSYVYLFVTYLKLKDDVNAQKIAEKFKQRFPDAHGDKLFSEIKAKLQ